MTTARTCSFLGPAVPSGLPTPPSCPASSPRFGVRFPIDAPRALPSPSPGDASFRTPESGRVPVHEAASPNGVAGVRDENYGVPGRWTCVRGHLNVHAGPDVREALDRTTRECRPAGSLDPESSSTDPASRKDTRSVLGWPGRHEGIRLSGDCSVVTKRTAGENRARVVRGEGRTAGGRGSVRWG